MLILGTETCMRVINEFPYYFLHLQTNKQKAKRVNICVVTFPWNKWCLLKWKKISFIKCEKINEIRNKWKKPSHFSRLKSTWASCCKKRVKNWPKSYRPCLKGFQHWLHLPVSDCLNTSKNSRDNLQCQN